MKLKLLHYELCYAVWTFAYFTSKFSFGGAAIGRVSRSANCNSAYCWRGCTTPDSASSRLLSSGGIGSDLPTSTSVSSAGAGAKSQSSAEVSVGAIAFDFDCALNEKHHSQVSYVQNENEVLINYQQLNTYSIY